MPEHKNQGLSFDSPDFFTLICGDLPDDCLSGLLSRGFRVIRMPVNRAVDRTVGRHTDLSVCVVGGSALVRPGLAGCSEITGSLIRAGKRVILAEREPSGDYPADSGLCGCVCGPFFICRTDSCDPALLRAAEAEGLSVLGVRQGYSACSCLPLPDGSLITDDPGIARAFGKASDKDLLLVSRGSVSLPGFDTPETGGGFFGGCCGLCGDTAVFAGDLSAHPDHERITAFLASHRVGVLCAGSGRLFDTGKLLFLKTETS